MQLLLEEGLPFIIGAMAYGFPIDGILGMDILTQTGAIIDLQRLTLEFATP